MSQDYHGKQENEIAKLQDACAIHGYRKKAKAAVIEQITKVANDNGRTRDECYDVLKQMVENGKTVNIAEHRPQSITREICLEFLARFPTTAVTTLLKELHFEPPSDSSEEDLPPANQRKKGGRKGLKDVISNAAAQQKQDPPPPPATQPELHALTNEDLEEKFADFEEALLQKVAGVMQEQLKNIKTPSHEATRTKDQNSQRTRHRHESDSESEGDIYDLNDPVECKKLIAQIAKSCRLLPSLDLHHTWMYPTLAAEKLSVEQFATQMHSFQTEALNARQQATEEQKLFLHNRRRTIMNVFEWYVTAPTGVPLRRWELLKELTYLIEEFIVAVLHVRFFGAPGEKAVETFRKQVTEDRDKVWTGKKGHYNIPQIYEKAVKEAFTLFRKGSRRRKTGADNNPSSSRSPASTGQQDSTSRPSTPTSGRRSFSGSAPNAVY